MTVSEEKITTKLQHRLVFQLGIPFLLFVIFLVLGLSFVTFYSYSRDLKQAEEVPRGISLNVKESVTAFFDYLRLDLTLAATSLEYPLDTGSAFIENIVRNNPAILTISFYDSRGALLYSVSKPTARSSLPQTIEKERLLQVLETGETALEKPVVSGHGVPVQVWTMPASFSTGESLGVMQATIDISTLWAVISGLSAGGLAQVYLLDGDGAVLVSSNVSKEISEERGRAILATLEAAANPTRYTGINDVAVIGSAEKLSFTDWYAIAEVPISAFTERFSRTLLVFLSFALLFLLILSYEVYALRRYLLTPLSTFVKRIREFGEGNYATRVVLSVKNEFSLLAAVVNSMAANIEKQSSTNIEKLKATVADLDRSGRLLIRRDLELTRANEQLNALDKLKTDFVATATHQLRTPLTAIRWTLSMLLHGDIGPLTTEQRTFLMKTYESNNRMIALLNDIRASDEVTSGKIHVTKDASMLPDLPDNILLEIRPLAEKRSITLRFEGRKDSYPSVQIDPQNLRAILQNLFENAIKYTPPGGTVTLRISEGDGFIKFTVSDTGIGIPKEQEKDVFKRFFRAPNAVKMETDGSGLGLFIAKGIVEKYGGNIRFESVENTGTTFFVQLPIANGVHLRNTRNSTTTP